jgi:hypothetical protein
MTMRVQRRGTATADVCARAYPRALRFWVLLAAAWVAIATLGAGCVGPGLEPPDSDSNTGGPGGTPSTGGNAGARAGAGGFGSGASGRGGSGGGAPGAGASGASGGGGMGAPTLDAGAEADGGIDADEDGGALR